MRHKSLIVVVVSGLFFRNLSIVALEIWWLLIKVYVDSLDFFNVDQKGEYVIIVIPHFYVSIISIKYRYFLDYGHDNDYNTEKKRDYN